MWEEMTENNSYTAPPSFTIIRSILHAAVAVSISLFALSCNSSSQVSVKNLQWVFAEKLCLISFIVANQSRSTIRARIRLRAYASRTLDGATVFDPIGQEFAEREFKPGDSDQIDISMETMGGLTCSLVDATVAESK